MNIGEAINMAVETASDVFRDELDTIRRASNLNPVIGAVTSGLKAAGFKNITSTKDAIREYREDPTRIVGDVINVGSTAAGIAGGGIIAKGAGRAATTSIKATRAAHRAGRTAKSVRKAVRVMQSSSSKGQKVAKAMARSPTYRQAVKARQVADTAAADLRRASLRTTAATFPDSAEDSYQAADSIIEQNKRRRK